MNVNIGILMPELVKNYLLFVKISSQKKISCSAGTDGGHFGKRCFMCPCPPPPPLNLEGHRSLFLRSPCKLHKTTRKLSFHENGRGTQENDPANQRAVVSICCTHKTEGLVWG